MNRLKLLSIALLLSVQVYSQQEYIDSLKQVLLNNVSDSIKAYTYLSLSGEYLNINTDSALIYTNNAQAISSRRKDTLLIIKTALMYGYIYNTNSNYTEARKNFEIVLYFAGVKKDSGLIASSYGNIGNTYLYEKKTSQAIEYFLKALDIFEKKGNKKGLATVYSVIGNLYLSMEKFDDALIYYQKGLSLFEEIGWKSYAATSIMNIGLIYKNKEDYKKAIDHFNRAQEIHLENGNYLEAAKCLGNIGSVEFKLGNYSKSIDYHLKSFQAFEKVNARRDASISLMSIGSAYDSLKNVGKAKYYFERSLLMIDSLDQPALKAELSVQIYKLSKKMNNLGDALKYYELYSEYNDTIIARENRKYLTELLTKYETTQKEKEIELQNEKIRRKNILVVSIFSLLILLIVLIAVLLVNYRRKQKANEILEQKNNLISQQKEEILTQNEILHQQKEEIEAQRDEVVQQRDKIVYQNLLITDSIEYAKHIQNAVLPSKDMLKEYFTDSFIYYQPRDIVSGDFYWMKRIGNSMLVALADCTGHGVPGAFMSMLGMTLLNDILADQNSISSSTILEELRTRVKFSLKQSGKKFEAKDGIDIAICIVNLEKMEMEYSGANIPLHLIRNNELIEFEPTKNPIGYHPKEIEFKHQQINLKRNDIFYLYSDGIVDQLGGTKYLKYMKHNLHSTLISINELPMETQQLKLKQIHEEWKGINDQTDDVLIMGIKI